jgi:hypothetical protein
LDDGDNVRPAQDRANALYREITTIRARQQDRELTHELRAMLYGSLPILGLSPSAYARQSAAFGEMLSLNVIQSLVDTGNAKITKTRPKPMYLTEAGDYKQQKQAKARTKYIEGLFFELKAYEHGAKCQKLGAIFGTGETKAYIEGGEIKIRTVYPWEKVVDDAESQHRSDLRTQYQRSYVDRYVLADFARRYEMDNGRPEGDTDPMPLWQRVLAAAPGGEEVRDVHLNATADLLCVYEGWHLPTWKGNDDGKHILALREFPLIVGPWKRMRFPFSLYDWEKPMQGYWGKGIAEILCGVQVEINELLGQIQNGHHLIRGWWSANRSADLRLAHINNDLARIMEWSGDKEPQYISPQIIAPEIYNHLRSLYAWAHDLAGVSEASSQGEKPIGVESGAAIRTVGDLQSERLFKQGDHYQEYYLDLADQITDLSEELAQQGHAPVAKTIDKRELVYINWDEVKGDTFVTKAFPISAYATDPAGRRSDVQEDLQAGFIDPDTALDLLDYPDLDEYSRRKNGWRRCIEADITRMVDDGVYASPEPTYRLDGSDGKGPGAREMVRDAINDYKDRGVDEDRLDLLRTYAQAVEILIKKNAPPPAPGGPSPGTPPGGPPPGGVLAPQAPPPPPPASPV